MSTRDPDPTLPSQPAPGDTAPVTRPVTEAGGGPGDGGPGDGDWGTGGGGDDDGGDRRRLGLLAGGVAALGLLIGAGIAIATTGGDDERSQDTTTSTSTTTTMPTSTTTAPSTTTTNPPAPQVLQLTASPSPVSCTGSPSKELTLSWATANTSGVTISIDGAPFGNFGPTNNTKAPFMCPGPHTYVLTANGLNGQQAQEQVVVQGISPPTTSSTSP